MARSRRLIFGIAALGSLGGLGVLFAGRVDTALEAREAAEAPVAIEAPRVRVQPLQRHALEARVSFTGTLRAVRRVDIVPEVGGRIESVAVTVGDDVQVGQLLAEIEHRSLGLAASQAKANRSAAAATLQRTQVDLDAAQRELTRVRGLAQQGVIGQADVERSQAAVDTAQAAMQAAAAQHRGAKAAAGLSADSLLDSRIVSPLAGTVTKREVHIGTWMKPGAVMFEIQDIDELELVAAVTATDFARLELGQAVEIRVDARPEESFTGTVKTMSPSLDPATRRATIEIAVANPEHHLLPNQFADATVVVQRREGVLAVPRDAVVATPDGEGLFTVRDGTAVLVHPKLGSTEDDFVPVHGGLDEGEPVVVLGHAELRDGLAVVVVEEAAP